MKMMMVGTGGVGESIAKILKTRDAEGKWLEKVVLADYDEKRAREVAKRLGGGPRYVPIRLDATDKKTIVNAALSHGVDFIMDAAAPFVSNNIFDAAFEAGCDYMSMGTWSVPDETDPCGKPYQEWMSEYNFARHEEWLEKGRTAMIGFGIDPGVVDVFAAFAAKHLFDELDEIHVKDGDNLEVEGMDIAFGFNVWTVLDECLNPNVAWDSSKEGYTINGQKGYYTAPPFDGEESFDFPEGVGRQKLVKVEHEETVFMPKYLASKGLKKCTFKIALGDELIHALKVIDALGLRSLEPAEVGGCTVRPRDVVAAVAPQPTDLGEKMRGKMCVGIDVYGKKNGLTRNVFLYQALDNRDTMERLGMQAVVAQTGFGAAIGIELLGTGVWKVVKGVHAPEGFPPEPYMKLMEEYDFPYGLVEKDSAYKRNEDKKVFRDILGRR